MLKYINIINLAVIHRITFELHDGLCLLTGETGAGKSIIVDALGFLLGRRGGAELVRTGERAAIIEGGFDLRGQSRINISRVLDEVGLISQTEEELLIRREIGVSGQNRIFVNDQRVTNSTLRKLQPFLVEILGQGEHFVLTSRHSHLDMLDNFAGCQALIQKTSRAFKKWRSAVESLSELLRSGAERERLIDYLRFQLTDIEKVNPQTGEETELMAEKSLLSNVEKVFELCSSGFVDLYEKEDSVLTRLAAVQRRVQELAFIDRRVEPLREMLESSAALLSEVADGLSTLGRGINFSEERLVEIENRLAEIQRLKRKFGRELDELLRLKEEIVEQLAQLESQEKDESTLRREAVSTGREYISAAQRLSNKRRAAVTSLEKRVTGELGHLALENAKFVVEIESFLPTFEPAQTAESEFELGDWAEGASSNGHLTKTGADQVVFMFSANKGEVPRPLNRVASGGELSRLMLAVRAVCLNRKDVGAGDTPGVTLIFDEIDAGIGGKTAEAVGLRLRQLAEAQQVLCVTHQPQIARFAEHHYVVSKELENERTVTRIRELDEEERVGELARMIGGAEDIKAARATAKWMLENKPTAVLT